MASIRISQLASVSAVTADDYLIVNDNDINTRKISYGDFSLGLIQSTAASQTLTGNLTIAGTLSPTDLVVDTDTLIVNSTTDSVGINVAGPAYALDVLGDIQIRNGNTLRFGDSTTSFAVTLQAAGTLTSNSSYTLPTAQPSANGMALVSTVAGAMDWASVLTDPMTAAGDMIIRNSANATDALPIGTAGHVLTVLGSGVPGWQASPAGFADPMTTAGDMIIKNALGITTRIGVGSNGQVLGVTGGVPAWQSGAAVPAGSNGLVQYNANGILGANGNFSFDAGTETLSSANVTISGNLTATTVASNLIPDTTGTKTLGSSTLRWSALYVSAGLNFLSPDALRTGQVTYSNTGGYNFLGSAAGGGLPAALNIYNGNSAFKVGLTVPNTLAASYDLKLPAADGTNGQVLTTNGSGTLSFTTVSGGGGTPGGADTQVQFNNSGAFAGSSALTWDGTTLAASNLTTANLTANGNTVIGDLNTADTVTITARVASNVVPTTNNTYNLGGPSLKWNNAYINLLNAGGLVYPTVDGTNGQVLTTNGSGALTFTTVSSGGTPPGGADTQIQFNNSGSFAGAAGLVWDGTTITTSGLSVTGNVALGDAVTDTVSFTGRVNSAILPLTDDTFDLGSASNKFRDLYLGSNSLHLGDTVIVGATAGDLLTVNTGAVITGALTANGLAYPTADGTDGQVLTTDGSGALTFTTVSGGASPAGSDTEIQFNDSGSFGASSNLSFNSNTGTLGTPAISTVNITVAATLLALGNVTLGDAITDTITFTGRANSNLVPLTNNSVNLGGPSLKWNNAYINLLNAGGLVYPTADGAAGTVVTSNGSGTLSLTAIPAPTPAGSDTQVQFNNGGVLAGDSNFTYSVGGGALGVLAVVSGSVNTATLTTTGNVILGDALSDTIALNGAVSTDLVPNADDTLLIGSSTARWSQLWISDGIEFSADAADEARITPLATGLQGLSIGNIPIHAGVDANTNNESVFIGYLTGSTDASARGSTVVGAQAGENMPSGASNSTYVGHKAGKSVTKSNNTAVGSSALAATPTGTGQTTCTMLGYAAGLSLTEGSHNVGIGAQDLFNLATGKGNVSIGFGNTSGLPSGGGGNVFIGAYNSGGTFAPTHTPGTGTVSNTVVMGCSAVANAYIQVAWTAVSDERDKLVMGSVPHGLDFVSKLKPVAYEFKRNGDRNEHRGNGVERYGFLAQDVLALEGDKPVIIDTTDEEKLKITSDSMIPVLVNAIKELKAEIEKLKNA